MENTIQNAQALYESKQYNTALKMCMDLVGTGTDEKILWPLTAKAFVFTIPAPTDESRMKIFLDIVTKSFMQAETIEEFEKIESDIYKAFCVWQAETIKTQISLLEENPTLEQWGKYIRQKPEYSKTLILFQITRSSLSLINEYCQNSGISKQDYTNKRSEELQQYTLLYDAALRIFEKVKCEFSSGNNIGSGEYVMAFSQKVTTALMTAKLMINYTIPEKDKSPDIRAERLKARAEVMDYLLNAMINANGKTLSMFSGKPRRDEIEELKEIYQELSEYDSNFIAPELPNAQAIGEATNSSGGGCYVATAVYGSYDCPEVWTLRRFRDYTLAETWYGRAFIRTYYAISPTLVKWFGHTEWFKLMWKGRLDRMVQNLQNKGFENTPYEDKKW